MTREQSSREKADIDISSTGTIFKISTPGKALISLNITATAEADYALDVGYASTDGSKVWFEAEETYKASNIDTTDIRDSFVAGDGQLRIRVTSPAASGETADLVIQQAHDL